MKILAVALLVFIGCKSKIHQKIITPYCLIFEYTGEENKPIPTLVFCDSTIQNFKMNYYDSFAWEMKCLIIYLLCFRIFDTITPTHYPLYKITSFMKSFKT